MFKWQFHSRAIQADTFFILSSSCRPGVTPGFFQQGPDSSDRGLKYVFLGTMNAKISKTILPSEGGLACSDGGSGALALLWRHP